MNKYQEALERLCCDCGEFDDSYYNCKLRAKGERCDEYKTLQELINNMKFVEEVQTPDYIRVQKELWESKK